MKQQSLFVQNVTSECGNNYSSPRILTGSRQWVFVERESVEELGIMLKMIHGLKKVFGGVLCQL